MSTPSSVAQRSSTWQDKLQGPSCLLIHARPPLPYACSVQEFIRQNIVSARLSGIVTLTPIASTLMILARTLRPFRLENKVSNIPIEHCAARRLPAPSYNVVSDRRGKRTAWSCTVSVSGQNVPAKYWYDGQYVNTAKEDAAEAALQKLQGKTSSGAASGGQQGRIVGWGK